jgi:hypothetical protein
MKATPGEKILSSLKTAIGNETRPMTLADASTKSGCSLYDTKEGLNYLIAEYRGNLAATSEGELLYSFPTGFTKPWQTQENLALTWGKIKKTTLGILKFVVRAWISIVMVAYVVIFALILIALTFSKNSDRDDGPNFSGSLMMHALMRLIFDSLFWTFHPFSPFRISDHEYDYARGYRKKMPFYERVNRFFFGPEPKLFDKQEATRLALQEIRALRGRIGVLDIMRVTGLSKDEADPFMAELMINYEGDVQVSDEGGIYYEFPALRKSSLNEITRPAPSIWNTREVLPEFTGNTASSNTLIFCLNGFNLLMSSVAIANQWTIEKFRYIFTLASQNIPLELVPPPPESHALLLGWIPFMFSLSLFLIPLGRALSRPQQKREIENKNGKRGLLRTILSKLRPSGIKEEELKKGWAEQAQAHPLEKEITREIIRLGGELELNENDAPVYRFKALEAEAKALMTARQKASSAEVQVGDVVFSSAR